MSADPVRPVPTPRVDTRLLHRSRDYQRMERALEWLATHPGPEPSLDDAASAVSMSPHHFQRMFTRWAGVSPKQFLQNLRLNRAKACLAAGASVFDAALDAGMSGPGRLHDAFVTVEAITPGEYKRALEGTTIRFGYHPSPFGEALLMSTDRGICALGFVSGGARDRTFDALAHRFRRACFHRDDVHTGGLAERVFARPRPPAAAPLKLFLAGTRFQIQVWRALLEIPEGAFASYEGLATRVGNPRAVRAVGTANGCNPISYLIPCHRVIRKTGALGGYAWGLGRKLAILGLEAGTAHADAS